MEKVTKAFDNCEGEDGWSPMEIAMTKLKRESMVCTLCILLKANFPICNIMKLFIILYAECVYIIHLQQQQA